MATANATQTEPTEAEKKAAADAEAKAKTEAAAKAAEEALTPEQREGQTVYQRAKFLHGSNYGPDPDKEVIRLPDGTDANNRTKWKEWDFRKPVGAATTTTEEEPPAKTEETETEEERTAREAKEAEAAAEVERKKAAAAAAKKKKPAPVAPSAPQPDPEEIANRTAEAVVNRMAPKPAQPAEEQFSAADQRVLTVLQGMEENEAYKGIVQATKDFWKKEKAYREKWEAEHSGEAYNRAGEQHADWYQRHNPEFKHADFDSDFETTQQEQAAERVINKRLGKREQDLDQREKTFTTSMRMREEAHEVEALSVAGQAQFVKTVLADAVKAVAGEGEFELTAETVKQLHEHATPVELKVIDELADEMGLVLQELERLTRYAGSYRPNPQWSVKLRSTEKEFFPHRELLTFANWLEAAVASDPNNAREGRQFLQTNQYQGKVATIANSAGDKATKEAALAELDRKYYRLTSEDVRDAYINEVTHRAGKRIKELTALVDATTTKKNGASKASPATTQQQPAATNIEPEPKPRAKPPASTSASDRVNVKAAKELTDDERLAIMRQNL